MGVWEKGSMGKGEYGERGVWGKGSSLLHIIYTVFFTTYNIHGPVYDI